VQEFTPFYQAHFHRTVRSVASITGSAAEDVAQEACRCSRSPRDVRPEQTAGAVLDDLQEILTNGASIVHDNAGSPDVVPGARDRGH